MKYKSVPVTDMSIWQLGQAIEEGGEFYDVDGAKIQLENHAIWSGRYGQIMISRQLSEGKITTREPVQWYEDLPKLVKYRDSIALAKNYDSKKPSAIDLGFGWAQREDCQPLTEGEAIKFGV